MSNVKPAAGRRPRRGMLSARPAGTPALRRHRTGRAIGGVASGIADHLGINVLWVRSAFALLAALDGAGILAYALLWIFVPQEQPGARDHQPTQREKQQAFALIALGISIAVAVGTLSGVVNTWIAVPIAVAIIGTVVVWREADSAQRRRWVDGARSGVSEVMLGSGGRRTALLRVALGAVLVAGSIGAVIARGQSLPQLQFALAVVLATLLGVAVLTVPWWMRLVRDLGDERRARIRTEERAEIAAHLHDSVLQTLALIQKQPEVSREVLRLARGQERQLRGWLYGPDGYGARNGVPGPTTLSQAIAEACGQIEDTFAIAVRPVVVGDAPMDHNLVALTQACREATVNAAKHSGAAEISVFAEVEPDNVTVFVRDRGKGFDPDAVSPDRHGLADSIRGRMDRHGGSVKLRTAVGEGTEVQLIMPRAVAAASRGRD